MLDKRLIMLWLGFVPAVALGSIPGEPIDATIAVDQEPNPAKAMPLDRWPNEQDLARLSAVKGQRKWQVIRALGHPRAVQRRWNGTEVWEYPWLAACTVSFEGDVCTETFYTSGW
jgi:hypothetical protein